MVFDQQQPFTKRGCIGKTAAQARKRIASGFPLLKLPRRHRYPHCNRGRLSIKPIACSLGGFAATFVAVQFERLPAELFHKVFVFVLYPLSCKTILIPFKFPTRYYLGSAGFSRFLRLTHVRQGSVRLSNTMLCAKSEPVFVGSMGGMHF